MWMMIHIHQRPFRMRNDDAPHESRSTTPLLRTNTKSIGLAVRDGGGTLEIGCFTPEYQLKIIQ